MPGRKTTSAETDPVVAGESNSERWARLKREGRRKEYQIRIDELLREGCTHRDARDQANKEFKPLKGSITVSELETTKKTALERLHHQVKRAHASEQEELEWVKCNVSVPWDKIDPKTAPSRAAISTLEWAKTPAGRSEFHRQTTKSQITALHKSGGVIGLRDDGRELVPLVDRLIKAGTEDPEGIPA